ncbi:MAG: sulfate adenylyltransferase, partial [Myxococcota bacterium]
MTMTPHGGGDLVNLRCPAAEKEDLLRRASGLTPLPLDPREVTDLELLAIGGLTPLHGFMGAAECKSVVDEMHLPDGTPWPIPVTISVDTGFADTISDGQEVALVDSTGSILGT